MKIVVMEPLGVGPDALSQLSAFLIQAGHELTCYDDRSADDLELIGRIHEAEVVLLANQPLRQPVLEHCPQLQMISIGFTGVDHVDVDYCRQRGMTLCNASGYATDAVAELTIGLILAVYRHIASCDQAARKGRDKEGLLGRELHGKTLGLVGTGAIGCRVAALAKAFGCSTLAWSRRESEEALALGVKYLPLPEVLAAADIVSLHVPATPETKGLIGPEQLALMKPSAILINTARGAVVDSAALAQALNEGRIAGAGLDVFDSEPPLPPDQPLRSAAHTVLCPHVGFATREALSQRAEIVFDNVRLWLEGRPQNLI